MEKLQSPLAWLYKWEKEAPNSLFLSQPRGGKNYDLTWAEAAHEVRKLAAVIQSKNLPPQSKIALVSKNCSYWVLCDLAIMMAGHISVPLYPNINEKMLRYVLNHSEAKLLFVGKLDDWEGMAAGVPEEVECISFPHYGSAEFEQWSSLTADIEPVTKNIDRDLDDVMTIIYTSGTTGSPKGVVHKFRSIAYASERAKAEIEIGGLEARLFSYLPLSHIAERMLIEIGALHNGAAIYFAESLDTFAKNLQAAKPSLFLGVPRIWTKFRTGILGKMPQKRLNILLKIPFISSIIKRKIKEGLGLNNAKYYFTGAAPTPPDLIHWYKKLDISLQEVYGMTENCAYSHFNREGKVRIGSAGQAMPDVQVKISEKGEILMKCDCLMVEYFKEKAMTEAVFTDGFFHTGDQGFVDDEGYLFITGRVKDIFKTAKGKYIAPNPIEMKISENPHLEQVCVTGSILAQPIALVVLSEEARQQTKETINSSLLDTLEALNPQLEKHERIAKIVVVEEEWTIENELLTPTMKIKRNAIDQRYKTQFEAWYTANETIIRPNGNK